ncbi:hypothetical protein F3Y22_tig00111917pilonHSYRG00053 [Hibiscus syriacus]|uniref:Uncharacterized protein n=1 Tax=Hibiscus syriacus TaxID=106335 RepID=A0A6A2YB21_HIBSY|nr:hypothetical protein F3Y22_tig00111917pilonHSYRG00053 [Hibiscus syriacus]
MPPFFSGWICLEFLLLAYFLTVAAWKLSVVAHAKELNGGVHTPIRELKSRARASHEPSTDIPSFVGGGGNSREKTLM